MSRSVEREFAPFYGPFKQFYGNHEVSVDTDENGGVVWPEFTTLMPKPFPVPMVFRRDGSIYSYLNVVSVEEHPQAMVPLCRSCEERKVFVDKHGHWKRICSTCCLRAIEEGGRDELYSY